LTAVILRAVVVGDADPIDASIDAGCERSVVGPAGIGAVILGLERPTRGEVVLLGTAIGAVPPEQARAVRARCAAILGPPYCVGNLSVRDNVAFSARYHRAMNERTAAARVEEALARFGLADVAGSLIWALPQARRRVVALARGWLAAPDVLVIAGDGDHDAILREATVARGGAVAVLA
jgi:ABC-type sulfate/molybdate transport systems ATPase subunit